MKPLAVAVLLFSAAACTPAEPPEPPPAPPPAPAPAPSLGGVDLTKPLKLIGTEPFWGVDIGPGALELTGVDRPEVTAPNAGPKADAASAVWEARGSDGKPLKITLTPEKCSDGMSDRTYALTAEVRHGDETLKGCADAAEVFTPGPGV